MPLDAKQKKQAAAIGAWLILFESRAQTALKKAVGVSVHQTVALGASPLQVRSAIRSVGATTVRHIRQGARVGSTRSWESLARQKVRPTLTLATDAARADAVAASLATSWSREVEEAAKEGGRWPGIAKTSLDRVQTDRTATTEAIQAYNDETAVLNDAAFAAGQFVSETWCAFLDACPECADLDGTVVVRPDVFPESPPLHPRCRCFCLTYVE